MRDKILKIIDRVAKEHNLNLSLRGDMLSKPFKEIGVDSLAVMSLIVEIETELEYQLPDPVLTKIKTINELINAFEKNKI